MVFLRSRWLCCKCSTTQLRSLTCISKRYHQLLDRCPGPFHDPCRHSEVLSRELEEMRYEYSEAYIDLRRSACLQLEMATQLWDCPGSPLFCCKTLQGVRLLLSGIAVEASSSKTSRTGRLTMVLSRHATATEELCLQDGWAKLRKSSPSETIWWT